MMTTLKRILPRGAGLVAALVLAAAPVRAESVLMTVDRPTMLNFLRAATPYSLEVSKAGFTETLILYNPRELRFEGGKIRLKIDCRGEVLPFSAVLEPTMSVSFDKTRNAFAAKVESLPVNLGAMGTIYLDQQIKPLLIPSAFSQTLQAGLPGLTIDTVVRDLKVLEDRIEARADLVFRKVPPAPRTSSGK
ncbi:MAG TPA: hypothetical protein VFG76_03580 [Candidatus Polarisedimenticolia bacterium]|nr:hypothetical protein [Candidatus Polarisedimenticolia bacterium]